MKPKKVALQHAPKLERQIQALLDSGLIFRVLVCMPLPCYLLPKRMVNYVCVFPKRMVNYVCVLAIVD